MIIALFALAAAMIVGGLLAAILGWDIVLIERGWTMVIAGSIFAASGALLLGIAAAVSRLSKMHEELSRLHADLNVDEPAVPTASDFSRAALAGAGGLLGGAAAASSEPPSGPDPDQPPLPLFPEAVEPSPEMNREVEAARRDEAPGEIAVTPAVYPGSAPEPEEAPEVRIPDFLIVGRHEATYAEPGEPEIEETLYEPEPQPAAEEAGQETVSDETRDEPVEPETAREEEPVPEPAAGEPAAGEKEPEPAAAEAAEEPSAATIIGTYNSGDNRYVMYSDGSIEAETPQGVFRFSSLDELKEFIAAGGESSSST